jgi:hypothetical protein
VRLFTLVAAAAGLFAATPAPLARLEASYVALRERRDAIEVAQARGLGRTPAGIPLAEAERSASRAAGILAAALARVPGPLDERDARALTTMRAAVEAMLRASTATADATPAESLRARTYRAYGDAARAVRLDDGTVTDRLTILGLLGREPDRARRERLFRALAPVWRTVNAANEADSPYRALAAAEAERWRAGSSPVETAARLLGVPEGELEPWLGRVLERWRDTVAVAGEPWDYWYAAGAATRTLGDRVPHAALCALNDRFYRDLGADPAALGVQYDLEPRAGKTPVAFTTFATRPHGGRGARPAVFATYRVGGFDNLVELLHETGHAVHIAAIRTRPAFADWPDSDVFTEALGDLAALEAYEPEWQARYLGATVPLQEGLRAKYTGVMLDVCWALFEWRVHREPGADPNVVWTELTERYLKIAPHPELSWWAMRGQLVDAPGYMMNYALGALLVADLRDRLRHERGPLSRPDARLYPWLSARLYRFGLERSSRDVVASFLGRDVRTDALLADLGRAQRASPER